MPPLNPLIPLFLTEGTLKLISGFAFILSPHSILQHIHPSSLLPPSSSSQASYPPTSVALTRLFGSQTIAFSIPLFLAARSADRKMMKFAYWAMLSREACLVAVLLGQIASNYFWEGKGENGGGERALEEGRIGEAKGESEEREMERWALGRGLGIWVAEVVPFMVMRVGVLGWGGWFD